MFEVSEKVKQGHFSTTYISINVILFCSWLGGGLLLYNLAQTQKLSKITSGWIAVIGVGLPGTVHNALVGMENIVFAALTLTYLICAYSLYQNPRKDLSQSGLGFGILAGLLILLRAEGVIPVIAVITVLTGRVWYYGRLKDCQNQRKKSN